MTYRLNWHQEIEVDSKWSRQRVHGFICGICQAHLAVWPDDIESLHVLGHNLTAMGRHQEALDVDRELVRRTPDDSIAVYNLACSLSNMHELDEAFETLLKAIDIGYRDFSFIEDDPDLENMRSDPRFELVRLRIQQGY